jgi:dGTPase
MALVSSEGEIEIARSIADYVAGMTDRFALLEHQRLCGGTGLGGLHGPAQR